MGIIESMDTRADIPPLSTAPRLERLEVLLRTLGHVGIGFSGGVDSTFLAAVCARCLPSCHVTLIHLDTPLIGTPEREAFAQSRARFEAQDIRVIEVAASPLTRDAVAANTPERCYHCKKFGFGLVLETARAAGCNTVLDGSNAEDRGDYRPGMRAVDELGVRSPLMETGWHKEDERALLHAWGFDVWDLPAGACLATRIPCGEALTAEKLHTVRMCEDYLHGLGLRQVRVRIDDGVARVSVGAGESVGAIVEAGSHAGACSNADGEPSRLAPAVIQELQARGCTSVDPVVHPYHHGEGNGAAPCKRLTCGASRPRQRQSKEDQAR